ncbi:MAG: PHP domain-containing protein [Chloroflexota bacterium]
MGKADLHIHTQYSWDGTCTVRAVLKQAMTVGLDVVAITDHDSVAGCAEAVEIAPAYGIDVIPGCEVSTREGHVLALFVKKPVQPHLPLLETLYQIGEQGGIAVAAHPYEAHAPSLGREDVEKALADPLAACVLVGIEAFNASLLFNKSRYLAAQLPGVVNLAATGSSDAHILRMIGGGATAFPGRCAADLRQSLLQRTSQVLRCDTLNLLRMLQSWVPRFLLRKAGWVTTNRVPEAPFSLARL